MTGKAPAFQFYPMDWVRDLDAHPLKIEGAWIRIVCRLWWSKTQGRETLTVEQWSRILRVNEPETLKIFDYIKEQEIGNVTKRHNNVTVENRRMYKAYKEKDNNKLRKREERSRGKSHEDVTTPSSSSSSTSKKVMRKPPPFHSQEFQDQKKESTEILNYLNKKCGKNIQPDKVGYKIIFDKLGEDYLKEQFIEVIDKKLKDPWFYKENRNLLCPESLFGKHFNKYLNENPADYKQPKEDEQKEPMPPGNIGGGH